MRRIHLLALLVAAAPLQHAFSQEAGAVAVSQIFARGSSPESVARAVAQAVQSDPSLSPSLVVEAVKTFARTLSGAELENAVSEIFRAVAEAAPECLVAAVAELSAKYPSLAIAAAEGAARGNPDLAREVSAAVLSAAPETDQTALATAVADAASLEYTAVLGWFSDPLGLSSLPTSAFPGGGGSSRPRPYSD